MALHINDVLDTVREGQREYDAASVEDDAFQKHTGLRLAYGRLSQAASDAYMIYSSKPKNSVFAEGGTSTWARDELAVLTSILGAQYCQQGLVETSRMLGEFEAWKQRTCTFVYKLNEDFNLDSGMQPARDWKEDEIERKRRQYEEFNKTLMGRDGVMDW